MKVFILQICEKEDATFSPDNCYNISVEAETIEEALPSMLKQFVILRHFIDDHDNNFYYDESESEPDFEAIKSLDDLAGFRYQLITHDLETHRLNLKYNF